MNSRQLRRHRHMTKMRLAALDRMQRKWDRERERLNESVRLWVDEVRSGGFKSKTYLQLFGGDRC